MVELTVEDLVSRDRARARLWLATQEYFETYDVLVLATAQALPFDAELEYPQSINGRAMENYLEWMRAVTVISATGCPAISTVASFRCSKPRTASKLICSRG